MRGPDGLVDVSALAKGARTMVRSPRSLSRALRMTAVKGLWLIRENRFGELLGLLVGLVLGRNPYYALQTRRSSAGFRKRPVHDYEMYLDAADAGISKTLLSYGTHEQRSMTVFREELRALAEEVTGDVTVLEVGANIGYFSLMEATVLGERADVHAIEPAPENVALLERNVALNGYGDRITVERCAPGDRNENATLRLAEHANCHRVSGPSAVPASDGGTVVGEEPPQPSGSSTGSISVPQVTGDRFLAERDIDPEDVDVVRMDLEGYETAVIDSMKPVFDASGPLLLYFEFHPNQVDPDAARGALSVLADNGFEIVSAASEIGYDIHWQPSWYGMSLDIDTFDDLLDSHHWVEVIARRR
jgi:FkbM family methyltransferase